MPGDESSLEMHFVAARSRLQTALLRSISRSFYLSIRFLPAQLREPIALAYLLARGTDSVADTAGISGRVPIEKQKLLSDGIQGKASRDVVVDLISSFFLFNDTATTEIYTLSLHDALPTAGPPG